MQPVKIRNRIFSYSHTIGKQSAGGAGFRYPVALALGEGDTIYVVNRGHDGEEAHRISVITADSGYIGQFGSLGEGDGQFVWPSAVVVDSQGLAYVADEWLNRISVYDVNVEFNGLNLQQSSFLRKWGASGAGEGCLGKPAGLALDQDENLYVTEGDNHRVSKFTRDGEFISAFGSQGSGPREFNTPWGITVDAEGCVYVVDWRNDRVQKFSPKNEYMTTIGASGTGHGQLHLPSGVAVYQDGDIYITDWWQNKMEVYDAQGAHLSTFMGDARELSKWGEEYLEINATDKESRDLVSNFEPEYGFVMPTDVVVDNQGRIFVADNIHFRIQVYRKTRA